MLIDSFAPKPDAVETHRIAIAAPREVVYRTLWTADLGASPVIKALLVLRSLPGFISRGCRPLPRNQKITLQTLFDSGFGALAEAPGKEIVLGITGRFWRPTGNVLPFASEQFQRPPLPGLAQAVWNFSLEELGKHQTVLSTETRVLCGDGSHGKFRAYWFVVRPFSGLIRRLMLRAVKRGCEDNH